MSDQLQSTEKVGIIIPTYNRASYFRQALHSVLRQTHHALEVVVVDDCSTDDTENHALEAGDPRVRYLKNEQNLGLCGSINKGIQLLSDDIAWCAVVCDDDMISSEYIAEMLGFVANKPNLTVAYGHIIYIDVNGNITKEAVKSPTAETAVSYLRGRALHRRDTYLTSIFFKKNEFEAIGGYPRFTTGLAADDALVFHLAARAGSVAFNVNAKAYIRLHPGAESLSLHSDIVRYYQSLIDYRDYSLAVTEGTRLTDLKTKVEKLLDMRIRHWLFGAIMDSYRHVLKRKTSTIDVTALSDLNQVLKLFPHYVPLRIKIDIALLGRYGIIAESIGLYRFTWRLLRPFTTWRCFLY